MSNPFLNHKAEALKSYTYCFISHATDDAPGDGQSCFNSKHYLKNSVKQFLRPIMLPCHCSW